MQGRKERLQKKLFYGTFVGVVRASQSYLSSGGRFLVCALHELTRTDPKRRSFKQRWFFPTSPRRRVPGEEQDRGFGGLVPHVSQPWTRSKNATWQSCPR